MGDKTFFFNFVFKLLLYQLILLGYFPPHTYIYIQLQSFIFSNIHANTHTHTQTHSNTYKYTQTYTHTHTHIHTNTHKHTHTKYIQKYTEYLYSCTSIYIQV